MYAMYSTYTVLVLRIIECCASLNQLSILRLVEISTTYEVLV